MGRVTRFPPAAGSLGAVEDRILDGPHGPLPVRTHEPAGPAVAGLVWVHGGAFFGGDLEMPESDWVARSLAARGVAVVTVSYRLAPRPVWAAQPGRPARAGVHFPVASEEVTAAFRWAAGAGLSAPASAWSLGGASAGANLAAGAALRLRDADGTRPRSLLLIYPLLHQALPPHRAELAAKVAALPEDARFAPDAVRDIALNYVRDPALLADPLAFPGGHALEGLPPTLVLNSDADGLRSSGEHFAAELAMAGVPLLLATEPGTEHGHLNRPEEPAAHRSLDRMHLWLTADPAGGAASDVRPELEATTP